LPHVVNYELPMVPSDYVHRIGRTGRAGMEGDAISLVCVDEGPLLRDIERLLGAPIPTAVVPGFEPDRSIRAEPIRLRSGGGAPRGGGRHAPRRQAAHAGSFSQPRSGGPRRQWPRRGGTPGSSIGNRPARWTSLPGERKGR
ncbi:MAG TPA: helicase-related protein, partial [Candidatus Limnocylindria bacterium]